VYLAFEGGGFGAAPVAGAALVLSTVVLLWALFSRRWLRLGGTLGKVAIGAFALYGVWTLLSAVWSNDLGRALVEFDRALLYLLCLVIGLSILPSAVQIRAVTRGLACGTLVVCVVAFIARALPRVWPIRPELANERLSFPVTYWNAMGLLATLAILLLAGVSSESHESRATRVLAGAGIPVAAAVLLLTFSRGAIAACVIGCVCFLALAGWRAIGTAVAVAPGTALALVSAYRADLLAKPDPTTHAAVAQGHRLALLVGVATIGTALLRSLGLFFEDRLAASSRGALRPRVSFTLASFVVVGAVVVAIVAGVPHIVQRDVHAFVKSSPIPSGPVRGRLTSLSGNGRVQNWQAALDAFDREPVRGTGAGTYQFAWYRYRSDGAFYVVNAHNLYLETLADLGVVGLVLLVAVLGSVLFALLAAVRTADRAIYGALSAGYIAWLVHAGVDWDWQMPVITAWLFFVGGFVLNAAGLPSRMSPRGRTGLAIAAVGVSVFAGALLLTEQRIGTASSARSRGECVAARAAARSATSILDVFPQPYEVLGNCEIARGQPRAAIGAMQQARDLEPQNWQYEMDVAVAQALAGVDPRPAIRAAARLNPREGTVGLMSSLLNTSSKARWKSVSTSAISQLGGLGPPLRAVVHRGRP
jgi:O-antigen ligase